MMTPQGRGKSNGKRTKKTKEPNMVVVTVTDKPGGSRELDVGVTGNLKLAEAPTLLKLASRIAEQQLGLE